MKKEIIQVTFAGGQSRNITRADGQMAGCNYMIGWAEDEDGDEVELYAEAVMDEDSEDDPELFGYEECKAEILRQAAEHGITAGIEFGF